MSDDSSVHWLAIITEEGRLSLGRVLAIMCFGLMVWFWFNEPAVPSTLLTVFMSLMGYNASKKVADPLRSYLDKRREELRRVPPEDNDAGTE